MSHLDPQHLRRAFGSFLTGVTVVTTVDAAGNRYGFTANSFTSVSIEPPLLLVCPGKFLSSFDAFRTCTHFVVNILAEGQEDIANIFAGFKGDRFAQVEWSPNEKGVPVLGHAATYFSCDTHQIIPAGDHVILMGEVTEFKKSDQRGLGYSSGRFFSLGLERDAAMPHPDSQSVAGVIVEHKGHILLQDTPQGWSLPHVTIDADHSARQTLADYFNTANMPLTLGKAFSIFSDRPSGTRFTYIQAQVTADHSNSLGTFVPISNLSNYRMRSEAEKSMLARYALERVTGHFGLYVGNEQSGDIHSYDERT